MTEKNPGWLQAESRTKRGNSRVIVNLMTRCEREMQTENSAERWAKGERVGRKQRKKDSRDKEKTEEDKVRKMCTNKVETSEWVSEYVRRRERKRERWRGEVLVVFLPQGLPGKKQLGLLANLSLLYCENNSLCLYTHSLTHAHWKYCTNSAVCMLKYKL